MRIIAVNLMFTLALFVGVIFLQVYLARRESKWPGLMLPIISFLFGLLYPLNMTAPSEGVKAGFIAQIIVVWLVGNIPTIVVLAIYAACREKKRRNTQLNKMNIQDLG